jgi:hypothetical protein
MTRILWPAIALVATLLLMAPSAAVADEPDPEPVTQETMAEFATTRSQIYNGFVLLIEGMQEGEGIDVWAMEYLDAAFGVAEGTMELLKAIETFSVPVGAVQWALTITDLYDTAGNIQQMYTDINTLLDDWSDGFIVGDLGLLWSPGVIGFQDDGASLKADLTELKAMAEQEAILWPGVQNDLLSIYTVEEHLGAELVVVEEALAIAEDMVALALQWETNGTVPNTFVCDFGEPSACAKLIETNVNITTAIRDFLLSEQAYLTGFLAALATVEIECSPGDETDEPCGNCGYKIFVCGDDGMWPADADCANEGECAPGEEDEQTCGNCGVQKRLCSQNCTYSQWGGCTDQGECAPGDENISACGDCGIQTQPCTDECVWGVTGECVGADHIVCFVDSDDDGFGSKETPPVCDCPVGTLLQDGDCDDGNADVNPDADEICNEIDDDCDDDIDEDDVCAPDVTPDVAEDLVEEPDVTGGEDTPEEQTPDVPIAADDVPAAPGEDVPADAAENDATSGGESISKGDDGCTASPHGRQAVLLPILLLMMALAATRRIRA